MAGPHPAVAVVRSAVRDALEDLGAGSTVLVACSGGADSLALAAATAFVAPRAGITAAAVVVDHRLQPGSADVAERAAEQCRTLGLSATVSAVDVDPGARGGPEAAARAARYAALDRAAADAGAAAVLLGHTLDDQAESVLLGLARGSGSRSLAGMAARRGLLRRPLLRVRRSTTERVCAVLGLEPWHDPTNTVDPSEVTAPLRSRLRSGPLPALEAVLGPGLVPALARSAELLREDADALDVLAEQAMTAARTGSGPDCELDVERLLTLPAAVRRRVLRAAAVAAGAPSGSVSLGHVAAVDALLVDWRGQGPVALPGGTEARRRYGRLTLRRT